MYLNPKVKKGDSIVIKKSTQGLSAWQGEIVEVTIATMNMTTGNFKVKRKTGATGTLYYQYDEFILADRKEQAAYLKEKIKGIQLEVKEMKAEIEYLDKYDSDEEFVAMKIDKLLKAKGVKAKTEILKELKRSNIL